MEQTQKEKLLEYKRKWYFANREKLLPIQAQRIALWRKNNPEENRKRMKEQYWNNREKRLADQKKSYAKYSQKYLERVKIRATALRAETLKAYGNKCACLNCPETMTEFLTIDHINGGGNKHRKEISNGKYNVGGTYFYGWLKKNNWPSGFQCLCHNCNMAKALYGSCPHQSPKSCVMP